MRGKIIITVLSLFDGIGCAKVALDRLNIPIYTYYAAETNPHAIQTALKNNPSIVQLGDVKNWRSWSIKQPDLIIGGSPCQNLSRSGNRMGLNGNHSSLFYEFVNILYTYNPRYFVLENVVLRPFDEWLFNLYLGVKPLLINSALVSAQVRERLYWTNIPGIQQPEDKNIKVRDILTDNHAYISPTYCPQFTIKPVNVKGCLKIGYYKKDQRANRVYSTYGKSVTLCATSGGWGAPAGLYKTPEGICKPSPLECERLQTLPDNYTAGLSNSNRYILLGNSFTADVIQHILSYTQWSLL